VFPEELRPFVPEGRRELKVSLGREDEPGFLGRYEAAKGQYDKIVSAARRRLEGAFDALDAPQIAYLAELHRVQSMAGDEEARFSSDERELFLAARVGLEAVGVAFTTPWPDRAARRWAEQTHETTEITLATYRELRAMGDLEGMADLWRDEALDLCEAAGLVIDTSAEEPLRNLSRALNDAAISACEAKLRRLDGDDVPTPPEPARTDAKRETSRSGAVPLLELFDGYATAQGITPGVRDEWRKYIERLIQFLGHDDASRITTEHLRDWRDKLLTEPSRKGTQRDPTTVRDKYITSVRATLAWAVEEEKLPTNVAAGITVRVPKKARLRDPGFTDAEAKAILKATLVPVTSRLSESYVRARRWIPWLCAYTGARVNELSQLRREDIQEVEGVWVVRITPEAGTVKTKEVRLVPLHEHLIEQGFLEVVQTLSPGPLFYDGSRQRVQGDGNRHFKKVGERLATWVREEVGISDPSLQPNHAWRHRFKSMSFLVGIEERVVDVIQGHSPSTTGRRYGKPPLKALAEAIGKLPRIEVEPE
jgi:integrase